MACDLIVRVNMIGTVVRPTRCWIAYRQKMALREQFSAPRSPEEGEELRGWREIQAAQFPYLLHKYEQHDRE